MLMGTGYKVRRILYCRGVKIQSARMRVLRRTKRELKRSPRSSGSVLRIILLFPPNKKEVKKLGRKK